MTLLTVAEYRLFDAAEAFEDEAIALILDATEAEIARAAGDTGSVTEFVHSGGRFAVLRREAASITSVTETPRVGAAVVLDGTDYQLWPGGTVVERLSTGTHPRAAWRDRTTVVYVPSDDIDIRRGVQVDLIKLSLRYAPGLAATSIGSWSETYSFVVGASTAERQAILSRLADGPRMAVLD